MANGHGGKRPNSGPEKGTKYAPTLDREAAEKHYRTRWQAKYDELIDAQYSTAVGVRQFVWKDEAGRYRVIGSPEELEARLSLGTAVEIVTRLANAQAQSDVLNRIIGKPADTLKHTGSDGGPVEFIVKKPW